MYSTCYINDIINYIFGITYMPWIKYQNKNRSIFHLETTRVRYTPQRHKEEKYFIKLCLFGLKKSVTQILWEKQLPPTGSLNNN